MVSNYEYIILTNNVILIGKTSFEENFTTIENPYLVQNNGTEVLLLPFLEAALKQKVPTFKTHNRNILSTIPVEKNDILDTYLSSITNIELPKQEIVV